MNPTKSFEQDDLLITPYLNEKEMPTAINQCLAQSKSPEERDIALLSALTAASAILPNYFFRYGHSAKKYYPNLQTFIMAGAASGKGMAGVGLDIVRDIDKDSHLLIPGDSTYPSFYRQLEEQNGVGYIHESEGSVITDIWRSGAQTYNTALRKAAEHEPISQGRVTRGQSQISCPRLSCLLTGTFSQFHKLVPSVENGFFSRLTMLVVRGRSVFDKSVFGASSTWPIQSSQSAAELSHRMQLLHNRLAKRETELEFRFTEEQAANVGEWFEKEYGVLVAQLGENFHPTIIRMGITLMRIAAIISLLRWNEVCPQTDDSGSEPEVLYCSDSTYRLSLLIAGKLLLHAADAYNQIEGNDTAAVPSVKGSYQRAMLLETLPHEFSHKDSVNLGAQYGISVRTVERWLDAWLIGGQLSQPKYGMYQKVA